MGRGAGAVQSRNIMLRQTACMRNSLRWRNRTEIEKCGVAVRKAVPQHGR